MTEDATPIEDALASQFDDYAVGDELHAVPPHRVHEVTVGGRRAVCKVATGPQAHLRRDARVLQHVARETSVPVPEMLAVGDGFYVTEWLASVPDPDGPDADIAWTRAAGAGLATLHAETAFDSPGVLRAGDGAPASGASGNSSREGTDRDGRLVVADRETTAGALATYLDDLRDGVVGTGYVDVVDDVVAFLEANPGTFEGHDGAGTPVLCHGNWLPDHVGVEGDEVTSVIDFERALVASAEHDYWRAALPLFHGSESDEAVREAFRAGYESVRPLPPGFEQRRDLHWLAITASFVESLFVQDQHGPEGTRRRAERFREAVAESLADLDAEAA